RGFPLVRLLLPLILVGCAETATTPETIEVASGPARELALFTCQASVEQASVACEVAAPGSAGGVSLDQRTMGGQHRYVALASSSVTYEDEIFEFETTVRNLLTLPMSTADGESRSAQGVRIFFHELPTATSGSGAISLANATGTDIFT